MDKYLFIDIETAPAVEEFKKLDKVLQDFWIKKYERHKEEDQTRQEYWFWKAWLIPEFGRIVCISVWFEHNGTFHTKSFTDFDEKTMLEWFLKTYRPTERTLVGHNLKGFDLPWIIKRCLIHWLHIPKTMEVLDKAPWKVPHIDTMDMYKNASMSRTSLWLISYLLTWENPKDDIDWSQVAWLYYAWFAITDEDPLWQRNSNIERISTYCEKDVMATYEVFKKLKDHAKKADPYFKEPTTPSTGSADLNDWKV